MNPFPTFLGISSHFTFGCDHRYRVQGCRCPVC